jgi:hypothetical protein
MIFIRANSGCVNSIAVVPPGLFISFTFPLAGLYRFAIRGWILRLFI